jgi:hypothetical protein
MPEQAVAGDQAAVLPAVEDLPQGFLAKLALDPWGAGRQAPEQNPEDVGAGGVLLAEPAQGGDVAVGDAGVGIPPGPPRAAATRSAAWGRPGAGTVNLRPGPGAASPKEALCGQGEPPSD